MSELQALEGDVIVEWLKPGEYAETKHGIYMPNLQNRRDLQKAHGVKSGGYNLITDIEKDIVREGVVVSGTAYDFGAGAMIYFNRHDADEISHEGRTYFRVHNDKILALHL